MDGLGAEVVVIRNDEIILDEINQFDKIVLSPGPGLPQESNGMMEVIRQFHNKKPILGVCLGMQALAVCFNDEIYNLSDVRHGVQVNVNKVIESPLFNSIENQFKVGLYHSWAVECKEDSPFKITAKTDDDIIMSIEHEEYPLFGIQFHPESILTPHGKIIIDNFLSL
jgi:anthranilate synthase component 2